jgi:hypothetical protein
MRIRRTLIVGVPLIVAGAVVAAVLNVIAGVVIAIVGVGFVLPAGDSDSGDRSGGGGSSPLIFPGDPGSGGSVGPGAS